MEHELVRRDEGGFLEERQEIMAVHLAIPGHRLSHRLGNGRQDVHEAGWLVHHGTGWNVTRPPHHRGHPNTSIYSTVSFTSWEEDNQEIF